MSKKNILSQSLLCQKWLVLCVCSVMSNFLWPHGIQPARLLCPWDSPGKDTGVDCHFLLQGIFLTQGLSTGPLCLLAGRFFTTSTTWEACQNPYIQSNHEENTRGFPVVGHLTKHPASTPPNCPGQQNKVWETATDWMDKYNGILENEKRPRNEWNTDFL